MSDESIRQALAELPLATPPADLTARLRVMASHAREARVRSPFAWIERLAFEFNQVLRPLAVPATGGLLSSMLLFGTLIDTFNVQRYLKDEVPLGIYTQVSVDELSPFGGYGGDLLVEVTIDSKGRVSDFSIPGGSLTNGKMSEDQLRQIGNLILYSTFTPATAYGIPVSGKILVALHHINVRG